MPCFLHLLLLLCTLLYVPSCSSSPTNTSTLITANKTLTNPAQPNPMDCNALQQEVVVGRYLLQTNITATHAEQVARHNHAITCTLVFGVMIPLIALIEMYKSFLCMSNTITYWTQWILHVVGLVTGFLGIRIIANNTGSKLDRHQILGYVALLFALIQTVSVGLLEEKATSVGKACYYSFKFVALGLTVAELLVAPKNWMIYYLIFIVVFVLLSLVASCLNRKPVMKAVSEQPKPSNDNNNSSSSSSSNNNNNNSVKPCNDDSVSQYIPMLYEPPTGEMRNWNEGVLS